MRYMVFAALIVAVLSGCATYGSDMSADYVARQNADFRVWPPVYQGQAFPVQHMYDAAD